MSSVLCIVDTNVLLHSQPLGQIPWRDLVGADEIEIVLVSRVLRELDDKKNGDSEKLKKRAKRVLSQINEWLPPGTRVAQIAEGVSVRVHTREPATRDGLDFAVSDDRILACALELSEGREVRLVTGDTTMRFKAEDWSLQVVALPDAYRLREEEAPKASRAPMPQLIVGFVDPDGELKSHIEVKPSGLSAANEIAVVERKLRAMERQAAEEEQRLRAERELLERRVKEGEPFAASALRDLRDRQRWGGGIMLEPKEPSMDAWKRHLVDLKQFNQEHADTASVFLGIANVGSAPASDVIVDIGFPMSSSVCDFKPEPPDEPQPHQAFMNKALINAALNSSTVHAPPANALRVHREQDLIYVRITSKQLMHTKQLKWPIWMRVCEGFQIRGRLLAASPPLDQEFTLNVRLAAT